MNVIPNTAPSPRLLITAALEVAPTKSPKGDSKHKLKGTGLFTGNGRAIFVGLFVGAVAVIGVGYAYNRHRESASSTAILAPSVAQLPVAPVAPTVPVGPELLRTTSISLGQPRLAVINGKALTEGESLTVKTAGGIAVDLRVVRITDGQVELANGSQIVTSRLSMEGAPSAARGAVATSLVAQR
ncbi:MAG: hypothetical protein ABR589_12670 [Chthoniobacterales bacterium]